MCWWTLILYLYLVERYVCFDPITWKTPFVRLFVSPGQFDDLDIFIVSLGQNQRLLTLNLNTTLFFIASASLSLSWLQQNGLSTAACRILNRPLRTTRLFLINAARSIPCAQSEHCSACAWNYTYYYHTLTIAIIWFLKGGSFLCCKGLCFNAAFVLNRTTLFASNTDKEVKSPIGG